jgi:hypothetical protein
MRVRLDFFIGKALAEVGVSDTEVLLGQSASFTGTTTGQVAIYRDGAQLYFDHVNKQGGIHGRKIKVVSLDDGSDPKRTAANAKIHPRCPHAMARCKIERPELRKPSVDRWVSCHLDVA